MTWDKIVSIYNGLNQSTTPSPTPTPVPYPGTLLREGANNENVKLMQIYLNEIANSYPSIPKVEAVGLFGPLTKQAVTTFQRIFGLTPDGIIGKQTWDKIVEVYTNLKQNPQRPQYPGVLLREGANNENVKLMQTYLNTIANKYPSIPKVEAVGLFGPLTKQAVTTFQRIFGLTPDGIIGKQTWDKIVDVYYDLLK